ncbi:hypothetical protein ACQ4PT_062108 [Festuca glaucescens]
MASIQSRDESRHPPPLGLHGLSRAAFLPRAGETPRPAGGLPPLGLAGRAPLASFVIGTAGSDPVHQPSSSGVPARRIGLRRPARPPPPSEAGPSNWASLAGGRGSVSGASARSSYVGFNLFNGGGISFGGNLSNPNSVPGMSFGGSLSGINGSGGRNCLSSVIGSRNGISSGSDHGGNGLGSSAPATNFSMSFDGGDTGHGSGIGEGSGGSGGFRGSGYNPNFEHAGEYPPFQDQLQAPPRREIDLNALANKTPRTHYGTEVKRSIYALILQRNGPQAKLKRGVSSAVAQIAKCPRRVVQRIWQEGITKGSINAVKCNRKLKSGRPKIKMNIEALEAIPPLERTTLELVAGAMNMTKSTVFRRLKEKEIRRVTSELKPLLTEDNIKQRVAYCLRNLEPSSLEDLPTFKGGFNYVHIDEKWFFRTRKTQNIYLSHREEAPRRETKNNGHIQKIMFVSAMARPRYDAEGNCVFDGKIGVWAYVDWVQAQKKSRNRERGAWELKPSDRVNKEKSREYLVKYVLPAIKAKWPESDRWNTIFVQQDNAKTHIQPDDPLFLSEAARGGWDIRMVFQSPNSPDNNILDLGWFASIQAMFHKKMPKTRVFFLGRNF